MDDSSKNSKSFLEQLDEYIKKNRPASGAVRASKEKMYSGLFDEADVLRDVISKSASETEKNQKVLDDILKRASDIYEKKRGQVASSLAESDKIVRDSALAKSHVEDLVRQQSKSPSLGYLSEAEKMGKQVVPQGSPYDPASLKRKAAEAAAKISSEGKLPGTINLPGPDEVKDLVPTSGGPIQTVGQAAKNIGEDVIEAQYRNIPSFADKARGFGTKASPVLKSGLSGAATSVLTGGLYDTDQEAKQEEIRSGKRDIPHPDKPGYVFRGSDIVKAGSESPVAADVLPSMSDIFKRALAPAGSEAQMEAYKNIRKTGYGQLLHGGEEMPDRDEIKTDAEKSPSTFEKAKSFLGALFGSTEDKEALDQPASEKDKAEVERLIKQQATLSSIQPKKESSEDDDKFKSIMDKAASVPSKEEPSQDLEEEDEESEESVVQGEKEKPPVLDKTKKPSLDEMLSDAANKDLEERKKYSDLLKDAIAKRDFTQLAAQLGRAASQIGAGITGTVERGVVTKPVGGEIYDKMIELASQPISDLEKQRVLEIEERKMDPESSDSRAARAIMQEFGIKVPKTATAAFLEKQFPSIATLTARREQAEKERALAEERRQDRLEARMSREAIAEERAEDRRKERLEKDVTRFGTNKEIQEQRLAMDEIEAVEDKIRKFTSDPSFSFDTFNKKQYKGDIPGASLPFIGRTTFYDTDARELDSKFQAVLNQAIRSFAGKAVTKNELDRIRTQYEAGKFANEADYLQAMSDVKKAIRKGVSTTEKAFSKDVLKEYESRGGRVYSKDQPKEESKSTQKVSSAQLKALVSSKEKNPHGVPEEAVARHLINQGFSVEGY